MVFAATTDDITVIVRPMYLDDRSNFFEKRFAFGYAVRIENGGYEDVQLLRRHWQIREATGRFQDVEGEGVIGAQPVIAPGMAYEYESVCEIGAFEATMEGTYLMQRSGGARFRIAIPQCPLLVAAN